nr:YihY/virulence factor BrkB family protein [Micromonospora sp. DSM 115978]
GYPDLQDALVNSALAQFPIIGDQLRTDVRPLEGNTFALVISLLVGLYGSLGVARALQNALDTVWAVPRRSRPNPIMVRVRSLSLIVVFGVGVLMTTVLASITSGTDQLGAGFGVGVRVLALLLALAGNAALLLVVFRMLTAYPVAWRDVWVGAVVAACGWQGLQVLGTYYLTSRLRGSTQIYGLFGLVLGLIGWLFLLATMVVLAMEINTVRARKLYPRSLMTVFLDDVDLTESDERAYTSYARAEQFKASQRVEVTFDGEPSAPPPEQSREQSREHRAPHQPDSLEHGGDDAVGLQELPARQQAPSSGVGGAHPDSEPVPDVDVLDEGDSVG